MQQFCVITGNPVDGIFITGPFDSHDDATEWASSEQDGQDWWVTELQSPNEEQEQSNND